MACGDEAEGRGDQSQARLDGWQASNSIPNTTPSQNKHIPGEKHSQISPAQPNHFFPLKELQKNVFWRYLQP